MTERTNGSTDAPVQSRRNTPLLLGAIFAVMLVVVSALVVIAFLDPFGWDLFGRRRFVRAAYAIPPDSAFYLSLDVEALAGDDLNRYAWAFSEEMRGEGTSVYEELIRSLDENLQDELGMTFAEDIQPWLGSSVAMGVSGVMMDMYGDLDDIDLVVVIEVRNEAAADEFISTALDRISENRGEAFFEEQYEGVTMFYTEAREGQPALVISRSDDMLIFGMGKEDVMAAIDAQKGRSIADYDAYIDAMRELPKDRLMTMFMNGERYIEMIGEMASGLGGLLPTDIFGTAADSMANVGIGISLVEPGVQIDFVSLLTSDATPIDLDPAMIVGKEPRTSKLLPQDTYLYLVGAGISQSMEALDENMQEMDGLADLQQAMVMFEMLLGFNPFEDFLTKFDGELAFGLLPSGTGVLAQELDVPLGFVLLAEVSDAEGMISVLEDLSLTLENQGLGQVESFPQEDGMLYQLVDMFSGESVIHYGVTRGYFILASAQDVIDRVFSGGPDLTTNGSYQEVWRAFPPRMHPVFYVDVRGLLAAVRESMAPAMRESFDEETGQMWKPIQAVAIASEPIGNRVTRSAMILFIDTQ